MLHNTMTNQDRKDNRKAGAAIVGSLITGAAVGAAAVFLSDKKNQQKVKKTFDDVSRKAVKARDVLMQKSDEIKKEAGDSFAGFKEKADKTAQKVDNIDTEKIRADIKEEASKF